MLADVQAPIARAVDAIFRRAIAARASDVHIEPASDASGRIRLRIDGVMHDADVIDAPSYGLVVSRIKLLASLDIANRRLPQDGRYPLALDTHQIDARVSSIPTMNGEKLVIRLLDYQLALPRLDEIGMDESALAAYRLAARAPWGFIVVSGPTGSGKTTTLYGSIGELDRSSRNICSVEDPIEGRLPGVTQTQVSPRAGLTFPVALRSLVRQDPDVIMIGEMRDSETAAVGVAAALAGQTVFATVHSNDAARTIDRLVEFGVARRSLAAALTCVVAQRLVRRLCPHCRQREDVPDLFRATPAPASRFWYVPGGCATCEGTGYLGRVAVVEVLSIDDTLREAIASGASSTMLFQLAATNGHRSLFDAAAAKLAAGETSFAEVERVVGWWLR